MQNLTTKLLTIGLALTSCATSLAQSFNPTTPALNFNAFTQSAVTFNGGSSQGPVATGGDLILAGSSTNVATTTTGSYPSSSNSSSNYALAVAGRIWYNGGGQSQVSAGLLRVANLTGTTITVNGGGNNGQLDLTATGSSTGPDLFTVNSQNSNSVNNSQGINYSTAFANMQNYSTSIRTYDAMSGSQLTTANINKFTIPSGSGGTKTITISSGKINYINMTTTALNAMYTSGATYQFSTAPSSTTIVVFNITTNGNTGTFSWNPPTFGSLTSSNAPFIIWNFYGAQKINLTGTNTIYGTVFAPYASFIKTSSNNIEGQVIADSLTISGGEIRYQPFNATLPSSSVVLPVEGVTLSGQQNGGTAHLSWVTIGHGSSNLNLQRSTDGSTFASIAALNDDTYSYNDVLSAGNVYYRLTGLGIDGKTVYSNIVVMHSKVADNTTSVYPNPFTNEVVVRTTPSNSNINWVISDLAGRTLMSGTEAVNNGSFRIQGLTSLPIGMLLLEYSVDGMHYAQHIQKMQ
jgi:choice-of-anchor A domain-containing protein